MNKINRLGSSCGVDPSDQPHISDEKRPADRIIKGISEAIRDSIQTEVVGSSINSEILFHASEIIKDGASTKKRKCSDDLAEKVAEYVRTRLGKLPQEEKAMLAEGFELLARAERMKEAKELLDKLSKLKIPICQGLLLKKFQAYTEKRGRSVGPEGVCYGLTLLHMYYCFIGRPDEFFDSLCKASAADISKFDENLSEKTFRELNETEEIFESLINDIYSLHKDIQTGSQPDPLYTLKFLSKQDNIHKLKSAFRICSLFENENGSYRTLENLIFNILSCDRCERKYLLINTGDHAAGIFYDTKGISSLYESNNRFPLDRTYPLSKENIHLLVEQMTRGIIAKGRSVALGINVISDQTLNVDNLTDQSKEFLQTGIGDNKFTPLFIAAQKGYLDVVKYLIGEDADVNHAIKNGITPLWIAAQDGHLEVVKFLIGKGADVNRQAKDNVTPLWVATEHGHLDIVMYLIENGADVNLSGIIGTTPLWKASQKGHLKIVEFLTKEIAKVDCANNQKASRQWNDEQNGHVEVVDESIQAEVCVDQANEEGVTPLWIAAQNGHLDVVMHLIENGADVNLSGVNGTTPLWKASQKGHLKIVEFLTKEIAKVDCANNQRAYPQWNDEQNGHADIVEELIQAGVYVDQANEEGATPLWIAALNGHLNVVEFLIGKGVDVNHANIGDETSLHGASFNGHAEIVKLLLKYKAKADLKNTLGNNPLDLAVLNGHSNIAEILRESLNRSYS